MPCQPHHLAGFLSVLSEAYLLTEEALLFLEFW
jgi:hypothetical protein